MSRAAQMFSTPIPTKVNRDGYPAYERSLEEQFLQTLLTNSLGNTFYSDSNELLKEANEIHDQMLAKDPEFYAKALSFARNEGYMRLQPIFGLSKLAARDTYISNKELFKKVFDQVILIPSDLQDFMTIIDGQGRGQGGRTIKNTVSKWLNNHLSEFWAIKYNGQGRGYSLDDIIKTVHPKPDAAWKEDFFKWIIDGSNGDKFIHGKIHAYEQLKKATTVEEQMKWIQEGQLPHEVVTGVCKMVPDLWNALAPTMPVFALLRNLNTLDRHGVLEKNKKAIKDKLGNKEVLAKSKILPFRFLSAYKQLSKSWAKDVLRNAVELTFENIPDIPGKTAIFLDTSGSMDGEFLLTSSVFAYGLYKKTKGNGLFLTFDDEAHDSHPSLYDSVLSQAETIGARGSTDTGAPMRALMEPVDNIIMITDEQQNTGSAFYKELVKYRQKYNPNTKVFIIDVSPYRDAMVPKSDKNTWYIYGWSDQVLNFIASAINGFGSMVDAVNKN
jgi:60 kDa SS-A/Ro ribonucleoprotein